VEQIIDDISAGLCEPNADGVGILGGLQTPDVLPREDKLGYLVPKVSGSCHLEFAVFVIEQLSICELERAIRVNDWRWLSDRECCFSLAFARGFGIIGAVQLTAQLPFPSKVVK